MKQRLRGGYRAAATSKVECFVILAHGLQPLTIITKRTILDVGTALDPPLRRQEKFFKLKKKIKAFPLTCISKFLG